MERFDAATDHHLLLQDFRCAHPPISRVINGVTWSYLAAGAGERCVVLLPGALGVAETAFHYMLAFAGDYRVLSLDYPPACRQLDQLLAGLAGLLDAEGVDQVQLVGGSYSGPIAHHFAQRYPARVASLVFANTGLPRRRRVYLFALLMAVVVFVPPGLLLRLMRWSIQRFLGATTGLERFWRDYFYALLPQLTREWLWHRCALFGKLAWHGAGVTRWRGPTLIVEAAGDNLFDEPERRALSAAYPQANRLTIDATGHSSALNALAHHITAYGEFWHSVQSNQAPHGH
jgi:pimeloyl-ACP methyl ester carboxylesterase